MSGSYAARPADKESEKGRVATTKVQRYRAGHIPDWVEAGGDGDQNSAALTGTQVERSRTEGIAAPVIVRKADDPRLRRLAQRHTADEHAEDALARRREIRTAEVVAQQSRRHAGEEEEEDNARHPQSSGKLEDQGGVAKSRGGEGMEGAAGEGQQGGQEGGDGEREDGGRHSVAARRTSAAAEDADEDEALKKRQAVRER